MIHKGRRRCYLLKQVLTQWRDASTSSMKSASADNSMRGSSIMEQQQLVWPQPLSRLQAAIQAEVIWAPQRLNMWETRSAPATGAVWSHDHVMLQSESLQQPLRASRCSVKTLPVPSREPVFPSFDVSSLCLILFFSPTVQTGGIWPTKEASPVDQSSLLSFTNRIQLEQREETDLQ